VGASSNVTNALRRTHALIASELTKSEFARQTLTESSAALKKLDESYTSLDGMLASSRDLLGTLLKSQKSDTWYLQTALYMLMVTGAWLVFRRILYGPLWWLVWLPLRIVFGVGSTAGRAVMQSGGREAGQSGKAGVVIDGEIQVDGIPDESLPTAKVGREPKVTEEREDSDESMVEKVGKIVDAVNEADELGAIPGDVEDDDLQGRESAEVVVEDSRPRDEL
jgi:protein transport protein SEC20